MEENITQQRERSPVIHNVIVWNLTVLVILLSIFMTIKRQLLGIAAPFFLALGM